MAIVFNPNSGTLTCTIHGGRLSSDDGVFDAPCGGCEHEMDMAQAQADWDAMTSEAQEEEIAWSALHDMKRLARDTYVPEANEILF